jgi:hypothetical protein
MKFDSSIVQSHFQSPLGPITLAAMQVWRAFGLTVNVTCLLSWPQLHVGRRLLITRS